MTSSRMTKLLSLLLVLVMAFSLGACGSSNTDKPGDTTAPGSEPANTSTVTEAAKPADPMAKYEPGIEVTSVKSLSDEVQPAIAKKPDVVENNIWSRAYETELGIKVKYSWTVPSAQFDQKMNVAISSNDLPDIIPANARQFKMLVETGVATDMTQIFKDYATPFTMEMMQADSNVALGQSSIGDKLYALPNINGNVDGASMLWIRKDWLTNLGLQPPKTMADVFALSEAFTNNDPDKNGSNDTFGLGLEKALVGTGFAGLDGFFEGYHTYVNGWIKDASGKLAFGGVQPEVKTVLAKLAEMYKNKQIDKEFSVKDGGKVAESLISGKIGMVYGQHWIPFWPLQDSKNKDAKADWKPYPIVSNDDKPATPMINGSASLFYVINKNMKNPEAAVKLYNYYYAKDPALSKDFDPKFHGINGEQETYPDQKFWWAVMNSFYPQQNLFIHRGVKKYLETKDEESYNNFWVKDNVTQNEQYLAGDNKLWSAYGWSGTEGAFSVIDYYDTNKLFLLNSYIKADTKAMTEKGATLKQMRDETFTKIIMGTVSVDEFDNYVQKWKKLGGDDMTNEVNAEK